MKNLSHSKYLLPLLILTACGGSKTPVSDIAQMRQDAKTETEVGPVPQAKEKEYVSVDKIQNQPVSSAPDAGSVTVVPEKSLNFFYEGIASVAKYTLQVKIPGVQMKLSASNLPKDAIFVQTSADKYEIRWTPGYGTLSIGAKSAEVEVILTPVFVSAKTTTLEAQVRNLAFSQKVSLIVLPTTEKASAITTTLDKQVSEGQETPFSVTVRIPGLDNSGPNQPSVTWSKDASAQIAGANYREMDGVRYFTSDPSRAATEYLGDFKWKFNLIFDTKNNPVEDQRAKDGSIMADSSTTFTRTVIDIKSPGLYSPTTGIVVRVAIKRAPRAAPAAPVAAVAPAEKAADPTPKSATPKVPTKKSTPKTPPKKA